MRESSFAEAHDVIIERMREPKHAPVFVKHNLGAAGLVSVVSLIFDLWRCKRVGRTSVGRRGQDLDA